MAEAAPTPAICRRIRQRREELFDLDKPAARAERRANRYSQAEVAHRVGVTLGAYSRYEKDREPDWLKRRAIARALELPENYFDPADASEQMRQVLREELQPLVRLVEELEALVRGTEPPEDNV